MIGLDLIGAGEALASQTIMLRIRKIDPVRLKEALAEDKAWGLAISPALAVADKFPKLAIDMAIGSTKQQLETMGVTADLTVTDAPPPPRAPAETRTAFAVGALLGIAVAIGARWAYRRASGKGQGQ